MFVSLSLFAPEKLVSRDRFGSPVSALSFLTLRLNLVLSRGIPPAFGDGAHLFIPPTAIGSVPSLWDHVITY